MRKSLAELLYRRGVIPQDRSSDCDVKMKGDIVVVELGEAEGVEYGMACVVKPEMRRRKQRRSMKSMEASVRTIVVEDGNEEFSEGIWNV